MNNLGFPLRSSFLAFPLEGDSKVSFQRLQHQLQQFADILRFQNPDSPHLTLQFWQELMEIEYNQVMTQAEKIASRHSPFTLQSIGVSTFGSRGRDSVLFLDVSFSDELARIKKDCPWPSTKPFAPHITLARIRHPEKFSVHKKQIFKLLKDSAFSMYFDRLRLYAEVQGKKQTALQDFLLKEVTSDTSVPSVPSVPS